MWIFIDGTIDGIIVVEVLGDRVGTLVEQNSGWHNCRRHSRRKCRLGATDGISVGTKTGDKEKVDEGMADGFNVGARVGVSSMGSTDGDRERTDEGTEDG